MKVSLLISTYNGERDIRPFLNSVQNLECGGCDIEVVIRDDSSTDNTAEIIAQEYGWVILIKGTGGNTGFVNSINLAFKKTTGEIICCLNQDTILHSKFIAEGVAVLQQNPEVYGVNTNMIMPWIMSFDQFQKTDQTNIPSYEYQLTRYGFVRYVTVKKRVRVTNFMTGGGFFVRRSLVPQNGNLFDTAISMYCEDTELSLRLQSTGAKIVYCPAAIIYHNQASRKAASLSGLVKLIQITCNRFALFARIKSPATFTWNYPLYLVGIVLKMSFMGFSRQKKVAAYCAGVVVAFLFCILFPYWFVYSLFHRQPFAIPRSFD